MIVPGGTYVRAFYNLKLVSSSPLSVDKKPILLIYLKKFLYVQVFSNLVFSNHWLCENPIKAGIAKSRDYLRKYI